MVTDIMQINAGVITTVSLMKVLVGERLQISLGFVWEKDKSQSTDVRYYITSTGIVELDYVC